MTVMSLTGSGSPATTDVPEPPTSEFGTDQVDFSTESLASLRVSPGSPLARAIDRVLAEGDAATEAAARFNSIHPSDAPAARFQSIHGARFTAVY